MLETVYGWISATAIVFVVGVILAVIDTMIGGGE